MGWNRIPGTHPLSVCLWKNNDWSNRYKLQTFLLWIYSLIIQGSVWIMDSYFTKCGPHSDPRLYGLVYYVGKFLFVVLSFSLHLAKEEDSSLRLFFTSEQKIVTYNSILDVGNKNLLFTFWNLP